MNDSNAGSTRLEAIVEEVRTMAAEVFQLESLAAESSAETIEEWDSLRHLNLIVALETRYGILLDPLEAAELTSIRALAEAVLDRRA